MSMSTFQKVTLVSCVVLCVSLLLPKMLLSRGKKEMVQSEGLGRLPPMMHRQKMSEGRSQWASGSHPPRAHNTEAIAKAKGNGAGGGGGRRSSFMGQIIPIYGFGIFLYILYILFKITSKGKNTKHDHRFPALKTENMKRKITDYELAQLQEKLKETEEMMERIVSKVGHHPDGIKSVTTEHEEKLLRQLNEITRVMQEGRLMEEVSPEKEAEEVPYSEGWEGYPEETYPLHEEPACCRQGYSRVVVEGFDAGHTSAEELAERMEGMEGVEPEECYSVRSLVQEQEPLQPGGKQLPFCTQRDAFQYQGESAGDDEGEDDGGDDDAGGDEEEDPAVIAESLSFGCESFSDQEEEWDVSCQAAGATKDESLQETEIANELVFGVLRKRNK
ncbi:protein RIC-3 isoform X2 [Lepisosteus oculatus]|uniref:protein RIC-3 isoform X2 n=1 Tax=Lepisosteus oculatus TaxID=7918 RepID=UPI0035F52E94